MFFVFFYLSGPKKFSKSEICETTVFQPKTLLSKVSLFSNTEMDKNSMKLPDFLCFGPQISGPFVENVRAMSGPVKVSNPWPP